MKFACIFFWKKVYYYPVNNILTTRDRNWKKLDRIIIEVERKDEEDDNHDHDEKEEHS